MSRRTFERRFKAATGETCLLYLQKVRVEVAKQILEENSSFDEISYDVGYETVVFRKILTSTPDCGPQNIGISFKENGISRHEQSYSSSILSMSMISI